MLIMRLFSLLFATVIVTTLSSFASSALARDMPVVIGAYVAAPTRCIQASNSTLQFFNGEFVSAGRMTTVYPKPIAGNLWGDSVKNWETGRKDAVRIRILSSTSYNFQGQLFRHCPENTLSPTWRGSTPPRTKSPISAFSEQNSALCQIITVDQGPSRSFGQAVSTNQQRRLEAQLPALKRKYPGRTLEIACEGGD